VHVGEILEGLINMALPLIITIAIMVSYIFYFITKKLSFLQNSILFMLMAIVTKNYITIMSMEFKILKTTEDPSLFLFLLIVREIITPILILTFVNAFLLSKRKLNQICLFIATLGFMEGIDFLYIHFKVITFVNWNLGYALIVNIAYLLIGIGLGKLLLFLQKREEVSL
jgi:hypothetical protein